jgi:hypothetical protein
MAILTSTGGATGARRDWRAGIGEHRDGVGKVQKQIETYSKQRAVKAWVRGKAISWRDSSIRRYGVLSNVPIHLLFVGRNPIPDST